MSACLSGAAAYSFDLEKVKSPPSTSTTTTTRATSPSSTLSESSNSPLAISTRKPRTARKRPNQTYNEAAALLSSAYPNIFFSNDKDNKKTSQFFSKSPLLSDTDDGSELLLSYESIEEPDFLFHQPKSEFFLEQHKEEVSSSRGGGGFQVGEVVESIDFSDEFDAESILDEEIEEGIDSIMGNVESNSGEENQNHGIILNRSSKGIKTAGNLPLGLGLRSALRENDEANLMRFHTVDFEQISPRIQTTTAVTDEVKSETTKKVVVVEKSKKKKKKKVAAVSALAPPPMTESVREEIEERSSPLLKLNFDGILKAWSDKASPFADESLGSEATGADVNARLAQIDLFGDSGMREASVLRYKEKRRTRLYSKKIRYEVRKLNADQRPRMKGRFVRRPNESSPSGER